MCLPLQGWRPPPTGNPGSAPEYNIKREWGIVSFIYKSVSTIQNIEFQFNFLFDILLLKRDFNVSTW